MHAGSVTAFNSSTGSITRLRSASGRPITVTRRGRVAVSPPDDDTPTDRLVVTDRIGPGGAGRGGGCGRWPWWKMPTIESLLADEDGEDDYDGYRTLEAAAMSLREALLRVSGDDARLAVLADAAARGRTAGLEPCEYVGYFRGEDAAVAAMYELSRYAGGEQIARGLRALENDRVRTAALNALPPIVAKRVDGVSLMQSFATDDHRLNALAFAADRGSEVLAPALLSCFDNNGKRAEALRSLPASAVTDYNLRAVVMRFDDRWGNHRLAVFERLARERPGLCSDWLAACSDCFPPDSHHRMAAAIVAKRAMSGVRRTEATTPRAATTPTARIVVN